MSARFPLFFLAALMLAPSPAALADPRENEWSRIGRPASGPAQAIGGAAHGCLAGGIPLASDGPGYQVIRVSRKRYFGHPDTVAFVGRLGREAHTAGLPDFYVGDMAQPRGGPLPYGHASHQSGLDVDIWFTLDPKPRLKPEAREEVELPSMILPDQRGIDPKRFGAGQVTLLRLAASDPRVDRVFVNPLIKQALCRGFGGAGEGDRTWLQRIRPWYRHDDHFHVRLACPANSPDCEAQTPIPPGDGCDASLEAWLEKPLPPSPGNVASKPPRPVLPAACRAILTGR